MAAKSGKVVKALEPTEPEEAFEADQADPRKMAKVKAKEIEKKTGKYGSQKIPPHKPADAKVTKEKDQTETAKDSWIEIELVGEDDMPIAGEKYEIETPDGTIAKGTLDTNGFAKVEGFSPGECKVSFPNLDKDAWEKA